jgi:hypothetical protein
MYNYGSGMVLLTNPNDLIRDLELTYRNASYDKENKIVYAGNPLMNDLGIKSVVGQVQAIVNKITVMSFLNDEEIKGLMEFLADTLAKDLMLNRVQYNIKSVSARDRIFFSALSTTFITMKRAFEEGDRRFWKGSVQEIRQEVTQRPQKKSFLGFKF